MGAPFGNQNAAKAKQWAAAIERALTRRGDPSVDPDYPIARSPKMKALDSLAERFLVECDKGEIAAFREMGDRMDGKVSQPMGSDEDMPLRMVIGWMAPSK